MEEQHEDMPIDLEEQVAPPASPTNPRVMIDRAVVDAINRHAAEEPDHEIGGVLIGAITDEPEPAVLIEASIRGTAMSHTRGSVTFTHETWSEINRIFDAEYPTKRIVGWYHSHPGFGIFLSEFDLFIHRNFFSTPWQVAFVTDPVAHEWGIFTWRGDQLRLLGETTLYGPATAEPPPAALPAEAQAVPAEAPPPPHRRRFRIWGVTLVALAALLVLAGVAATYGLLTQTRAELAGVQADVAALRGEIQTAVGPPPSPEPAIPAPQSAAPAASPWAPEPSSPSASPTSPPPSAGAPSP